MKRLISLLLSVMLCCLCVTGWAADADELSRRANAGDAAAMTELGRAYRHGQYGLEQSDALAAYWFYRAAQAGDAEGMYYTGIMFYYGYGVERNTSEAMKWFKQAASAGDYEANLYVGVNYTNGTQGFGGDKNKAKSCFLAAAAEPKSVVAIQYYFGWETPSAACFDSVLRQAQDGSPAAMCDLAYLYYTGAGTEKNDPLAAYWWVMSAESGVSLAMFCASVVFMNGIGTAQNTKEGQRWIEKFVSMGLKDVASSYSRNYTASQRQAAPETALVTGPTGMVIDRNRPEDMIEQYGLDELVEAAVMDNHDAAYVLGCCYYWGLGVEEDPVSSFEWFLRIAEEGDTASYIWVGDAYSYGEGTEMDEEKAFYWYTKSAEAGDPEGMLCLGYSYMEGEGVQTNYAEGLKWMNRAISAGSEIAMYDMGLSYYEGSWGVQKDWNEALRLWRMGAERGSQSCKEALSLLEKEMAAQQTAPKNTQQTSPKTTNTGSVDIDRGQPEEMMSLLGVEGLIEAAQRGDLDAAYILGWCYYYGIGVDTSYEDSFGWFLRVAEEGDPSAYMWVADAYYFGMGTAQDYEEAIEWYREAAEEGDPRAMYMLGVMYQNGLGVRQDDRKADKWFSRAEEEGYEGGEEAPLPTKEDAPVRQTAPQSSRPTGTVSAGSIDIDAGRPEEMMNLLGLDELVEAAALGDLDAAYIIGWCFANGAGVEQDDELAFEWFLMLAEEGDPRAYIWVADAYYNGTGVAQDYEEAIKWYKVIAEDGDDSMMLKVGNFYFRGQITAQDYEEALRWYLLAAAEGNMTAMGNAADVYNHGYGSVPQDLEKAFALFKESAEGGNITSMNNTGVCYLQGRGTAKNTKQAVYWITLAAENGNAAAMNNLGQMYEHGVGVSKNAATARSWYEKAAAAGNADAKKKLGQ